jgi:hypothetical protein
MNVLRTGFYHPQRQFGHAGSTELYIIPLPKVHALEYVVILNLR